MGNRKRRPKPKKNTQLYLEQEKTMEIKVDEIVIKFSQRESEILTRLEKLRGSKLLIFFASETTYMNDDVPLIMFKLLRELGKTNKIDLLLHSRGGNTEVPAKLVPLIRNYCDDFSVLIPYRAHSAATHIALGADEIVMGPMSELGPVDPSRRHPLLPKDKDGNSIPISVQDLKHVIDLLKREGPEEQYTPEALALIFSKMFEYVHPLAIGAIEQSYALAKIISKKLLLTHMDPEKDMKEIERIANELSDGFKSHSYQICWKEATELGLPVCYNEDELYSLMWELYEKYFGEVNIYPNNNKTGTFSRPIFIIASASKKYVLIETSNVESHGAKKRLTPVFAKWFSEDDLKTKPEEAPMPAP